MIADAESPRHVLGVLARSDGEDQLAATKHLNGPAQFGMGIEQ